MKGEAAPPSVVPSARLLALQLGIFVGLGLPDGARGVVWPAMRASFHRPTADLGFVLAAGTLGYLFGSAGTGRIISRIGAGRMAWAATALAAVGLLCETGALSWVLLLAGAVILGTARGSIDAGLNAYVAEHGGVRQLGLLHAAYGVGTTTAPVIATVLLATGWRWTWAVLAAITVALSVWAWPARGRWPSDKPHHDVVAHPASGSRLSTALVMTLVTFGVYVGVELATGSWTFVLLTEHRHMDRVAAGIVVAGFWAGLTTGRLLLWRGGHRLSRVTILHLSCGGALLALLWLWANPAGGGWIGVPFAGFAMGPVFPTLVALTPDRLGADRAAWAIGWSVAASSLGGALLSALAGVLPLAPTLAAYGLALVLAHAALVAVTPHGHLDRSS